MTPFAQLDDRARLSKSAANPRALFKGLDGLVRHGLWETLGRTAKKKHTGVRALGNRASKWFTKKRLDPATGKVMRDPKTGKEVWQNTMLNNALTTYGIGGMGASMMGLNVPGSSLAFNTVMPGMGALFSVPSLVTAARASTPKNKQMLREDVMSGARTAAGDLITLGKHDSSFIKNPELYAQYLRETSPELADMATRYRSGAVKPVGGWEWASSLFENPQHLINNKVDMQVQNMLGKSGSIGSAAWTGVKRVFPWLFPTMGVGMLGHAMFSKKPYDEVQAKTRGYAGASAKMQEELKGMTGMQRFFAGLDPSLMAGHIEQKLPGTLAQWEQTNGQKYEPGLLGNLVGVPGLPGKDPNKAVSYYQMDAAGQRHYL